MLVAAIITPNGTCGRLLRAAVDGEFELVTSPMLVRELRQVLTRDKFRRYISHEEALIAVQSLAELAELIADPVPTPEGLSPDPKDDYLIALAQQAGVDYLVTGDQHLDAVASPAVVRPSALLNAVSSRPHGT